MECRAERIVEERRGFTAIGLWLRSSSAYVIRCYDVVMTDDEDLLLTGFRALDDAGRRRVLEVVHALRVPARGLVALSAREREIVGLLVAGCTDREIAARLHISPHTVKNHVTRLREKVGARNRTAAVVTLQQGLGEVGLV